MSRDKDIQDDDKFWFDNQTVREREMRYMSLFDDLDSFHEGKLTKSSLKLAFKRQNHPLKDSDIAIQELFRSMDLNHDGIVDFNDFKKFAYLTEFQIDKGFQLSLIHI